MQTLLTKSILLYQRYISVYLPPGCRFMPSCSDYMVEAVEQHGCLKGGVLGLRRLCRCHPLHTGGIDPVPVRSGKE